MIIEVTFSAYLNRFDSILISCSTVESSHPRGSSWVSHCAVSSYSPRGVLISVGVLLCQLSLHPCPAPVKPPHLPGLPCVSHRAVTSSTPVRNISLTGALICLFHRSCILVQPHINDRSLGLESPCNYKTGCNTTRCNFKRHCRSVYDK